MANMTYDNFKNRLLTAKMNVETTAFRVYLLDTTQYTFDRSHISLADIPEAARIATAQLTNTVLDNITLDADNVLFNDVVGPEVNAFVIAIDVDSVPNNDETLAYLVAYSDESEGLPVTPDGRPIAISWTDTTYKVFTL